MTDQVPVDNDDGRTALAALAADLANWDGSREARDDLRRRTRELPEVRNPPDASAGAVLKVRAAYELKDPTRLVTRFQAVGPCAYAPYFGDPAMGAWPYSDPLKAADAIALTWLPLIARFAMEDDDRARDFVDVLFRTRPRRTWVPASCALAQWAVRDSQAFDRLASHWAAAFPEGYDVRRFDRTHHKEESAVDEHVVRHSLHAACAYLAAGGTRPLHGLSPKQVATSKLPKDPSDASTILLAVRELVASAATRGETLPHVTKLIQIDTANELVDPVLRDMADVLRDDPAAAGVVADLETQLRRPLWAKHTGANGRTDALLSWLQSAIWFRDRGAPITSFQSDAAESAQALGLAIDGTMPAGEPDVGAALATRLRFLADSDTVATTGSTRLSALVAETVLLLAHPDAVELDWAALARRAGIGDPAIVCTSLPDKKRTVEQVGKAALALLLAAVDAVPNGLLRDANLPREAVLALASSSDGRIAIQVAVQVERLLREQATPADDLRFLWQLLQRNPHQKTFKELGEMLRGEPGTLHALVKALMDLDRVRDRGGSRTDVLESYRKVVESIEGHLPKPAPGTPLGPEYRFLALIERLRQVASAPEEDCGSAAWLDLVEEAIVGGSETCGIRLWMHWLECPADDLETHWRATRRAIEAVRVADLPFSSEQPRLLRERLDELGAGLENVAWPERKLFARVIDSTRRWIDSREGASAEAARKSAEAARHSAEAVKEIERLKDLMDRGDEEGVIAFAASGESGRLGKLPAEHVLRLHRFLLDHLHLRNAEALRDAVRERVPLRAVWMYLAPLIAGVASGTVLVLDVGTAFDDLAVKSSLPIAYWGTLAVTFISALALLWATLASRVRAGPPGKRSWFRRVAQSARRVAAPFLGATTIAGVVSAVTLWLLAPTRTLKGVDEPGEWVATWVLWTGLSLFLGLFVSIVVAGRGVGGEERR